MTTQMTGTGDEWPAVRLEPPEAEKELIRRGDTFAHGLDAVWGVYQSPDRAPKRRNETGGWWRCHDESAKE
jgi:predicted dithiol-disulfide oxidoreductase (DUF899 family)